MPAGATYEPIATASPTGTTTVTFNSFSGYTDLIVVCVPIWASGSSDIGVQFNSDTGTNYSSTYIRGDGTTASSTRNTSDTYIRGFGNSMASTTIPGLLKWNIFSYAGSTNKSVLVEGSNDLNGSGSVRRMVGLWRSTSAITSMTFTAIGGVNYGTGTRFTLYGIKAA